MNPAELNSTWVPQNLRESWCAAFSGRDERWLLWPVCSVLLIVATIAAARTPFWHDEATSWYLARLPWAAQRLQIIHEDSHPPLHYWLLKLWMLPWGDSELAQRSLSIAAAALCLFTVRAWLFDMYRDGGVAAAGTALVACSDIFLFHAQSSRPYECMAAAEVGSMFFMTRLYWTGTGSYRTNVIGFALCLAAGSLLHYHFAFVGMVELVVVWIWAPRVRRQTVRIFAVALLPFLIWGLPMLLLQLPSSNHAWVPLTDWHTVVVALAQNYRLHLAWIPFISVLVVLPTQGAMPRGAVCTLAIGITLLPILVGHWMPLYYPLNQGILDVVPIALLAAPALVRALKRSGVLLLLAVLVSHAIADLAPVCTATNTFSERLAVADMAPYLSNGDTVLATPMSYSVLRYYLRDRPQVFLNPDTSPYQPLGDRVFWYHADPPHPDLRPTLGVDFAKRARWRYRGLTASLHPSYFTTVDFYTR